MQTSEILKSAKDEMLQRGWCQGGFVGEHGEVCMEWAMNLALVNDRCFEAYPIAMNALRQATFGHADCQSIASWNDTPGRQPEEVLAAFDRAIAIAEQQEVETPAETAVTA